MDHSGRSSAVRPSAISVRSPNSLKSKSSSPSRGLRRTSNELISSRRSFILYVLIVAFIFVAFLSVIYWFGSSLIYSSSPSKNAIVAVDITNSNPQTHNENQSQIVDLKDDKQIPHSRIDSSVSQTHTNVLEYILSADPFFEIWSGSDLQYEICRISHVLITRDAEKELALFPRSIRQKLEQFDMFKRCGLLSTQYGFYDDKDQESLRKFIDSTESLESSGFDNNVIFPIFEPYEYHMPHFTANFIERDYTILGVFIDAKKYTHDDKLKLNSLCMTVSGSACEESVTGFSNRIEHQPLAHFLHQRAANDSASWVKQFMMAIDPEFQFIRREDIPSAPRAALFLSILTSKPQPPPEQFTVAHPLFSGLGMSVKQNVPCRRAAKIMFLDRISDHSRRFGYGRAFLRRDSLEKQVSQHANAAGISVELSVEYFERSSLREQALAMNQADVIVATHGAGLTNLVFMKKSALLIEVFPFSHVVGIFPKLAERMRIPYRLMLAKFQPAPFSHCLRLSNMEHARAHLEARRVMKEIEAVIERVRQYSNEMELTQNSDHPASVASEITVDIERWNIFRDKNITLSFLMPCLRHQDLLINATLLATTITSYLKSACA